MRTGLLANAAVLAAVAWLSTISVGNHQAKSLLAAPKAETPANAPELDTLESAAAHTPSVETIAALATAYIGRNQPGLASAAIERASQEIQGNPRIADLQARALLHRGQARKALATIERASQTCENNPTTCHPWQHAKLQNQSAFLQELVKAGIEDPKTPKPQNLNCNNHF